MKPLEVGLSDWIAYAPMHLAQELDYLVGPDIKMHFNLDTNVRYDLFRRKKLDCILVSVNAFCGEMWDADARIIAALVEVVQPGAERIVAKSAFRSMEDLRRATVCYVPGGLEHFYFHYFFSQAGVAFPEKVLETESRREMRERFRLGEADAAILYEPYIHEFTSKDAYHVIPNNADLSAVVAVLAAHDEVIEGRAGQLQALIDGYFGGLSYFNHSPEKALTKLMRYYPADVSDPLGSLRRKFVGFRYIQQEEHRRYCTTPGQGLYRAVEESFKVWKEIRAHISPPDTARLVDPRFAHRVAQGVLS